MQSELTFFHVAITAIFIIALVVVSSMFYHWDQRDELRRIVRQRVRFGYDYRTTKGRTF